jgi:hypothetical protein
MYLLAKTMLPLLRLRVGCVARYVKPAGSQQIKWHCRQQPGDEVAVKVALSPCYRHKPSGSVVPRAGPLQPRWLRGVVGSVSISTTDSAGASAGAGDGLVGDPIGFCDARASGAAAISISSAFCGLSRDTDRRDGSEDDAVNVAMLHQEVTDTARTAICFYNIPGE